MEKDADDVNVEFDSTQYNKNILKKAFDDTNHAKNQGQKSFWDVSLSYMLPSSRSTQ